MERATECVRDTCVQVRVHLTEHIETSRDVWDWIEFGAQVTFTVAVVFLVAGWLAGRR